MNEIMVTLGGRQFALPMLNTRPEAEWRRKAQEVLAPLLQAGDLAQMEISNAADIARAVSMFGNWLDPMAMLDALIAYAPTVLGPEREWLEYHTYGGEISGALLQLFFFGTAPIKSGANGVVPKRIATT
jgi:hypothetical protein